MKLYFTVVCLVLLSGCGTSSRIVILDTNQDHSILFAPRTGARPVEWSGEGFKQAVAMLSRQALPSPRPQQAARDLFEVGARSGAYSYEASSHRLVPLGSNEHPDGTATAQEAELTRDYLGWCGRTGRPGDCLRLLTEGPTVDGDGRFALALGLAKGVVLDELLEAFQSMAGPHAMVSAVLWTWTTYMLLLSVPEPLSKGVAAVMTATLVSYVGVDTFWGLIVGFRLLMDEADRATTFRELRTAGERYGKVMGRNAARAFVLLAMAALGSTAPVLAAQVPKLPGAMQAAVQAETQMGIRLAAVGQVETVAVSAEAVTISLAPNALAMATRGSGNESSRDTEKSSCDVYHDDTEPKSVYNGLKNTPGYPSNFRGIQNGTTKNPVLRQDLLEKLRAIEPGKWNKVYKDGWIGTGKASLHYFESPSGRIFGFKIKLEWSNQ